jgi:hypothetical protein
MNRRTFLALLVVGLVVGVSGVNAQEKKKRGGPIGRVKQISAEKITLTVGRKDEAKDTEFKLAKEVKVTINGESKTVSDVKEGMFVRLTVKDDLVVEISSAMRKKKDQ